MDEVEMESGGRRERGDWVSDGVESTEAREGGSFADNDKWHERDRACCAWVQLAEAVEQWEGGGVGTLTGGGGGVQRSGGARGLWSE